MDEGFDEIFQQFLKNFFPAHSFDLTRNSLKDLMTMQKKRDNIYDTTAYAVKLLEYLWLPLRVFHTDTDFHVVKYLAVFDVMVYQYSDDYVEQLEISKEKKRNNLFNDRKFLVTPKRQSSLRVQLAGSTKLTPSAIQWRFRRSCSAASHWLS